MDETSESSRADLIVGLDMGGTQTDSVVAGPDGLISTAKALTGEDLVETLTRALDRATAGIDPDRIARLTFSTTMAANAIIQDRLDGAGMLVSSGPGMDPDLFAVGPSYHVIKGSLDHRGIEAAPLDQGEVMDAARRIRTRGVSAAGVTGKFSVRNPMHELQTAEWIRPFFRHVAVGHTASGHLNFPRRITTTYLNASLHALHRSFVNALLGIIQQRGVKAPLYLLKPDGGTVGLEHSLLFPAQAVQSGPAASVMGALALDPCTNTTLVLDIGGTTTDIALVYRGAPLLEPTGVRIGPYSTLIRSLHTRSVGIGGDSEVRPGEGGLLRIGPLRQGPPAALGGPAPTPTDAMVQLGLLELGDPRAARSSLESLFSATRLGPDGTARAILVRMAELIAESTAAFVHFVNARPVYTIREVLEGKTITPSRAVVIGGPAAQLAEFVGSALRIPTFVPPHAEVANALGAAVSRVTCEVTLQADTARREAVIPEAGVQQAVSRDFDPEAAMSLARKALLDLASRTGATADPIETAVVEDKVFNMIQGFTRTGRLIRIRLCLVPGLLSGWNRGAA